MLKTENGFYLNNVFTYDNQECVFNEDTIHIEPNQPPVSKYKLQGISNKKIRFAYVAQSGLVRVAANGTVAEENILGKFIKLSDLPTSSFESFFKRNGFIFPLSDSGYNEIDPGALRGIVEKLRYTVELMSETSAVQKDYERILLLSLLLLFNHDISFQTSVMDQPYKVYEHELMSLIKDDKWASIPETTFATIIRSRPEDYRAYDMVYENTKVYDNELYTEIKSGYADTATLFKVIFYLHVNYHGDEDTKFLIDFLYNYMKDVGEIEDINYKNGIAYKGKPKIDGLTDRLKNAMIRFAQIIIGNEINANLSGIYPYYNRATMEPSWRVESLLSAMYFSMFYIRPDLELYRQCPRCGTYFLVKTTSTRKKYCSSSCCNAQTQETYRRTHPKNKDK